MRIAGKNRLGKGVPWQGGAGTGDCSRAVLKLVWYGCGDAAGHMDGR
jgi:hypothetical protein